MAAALARLPLGAFRGRSQGRDWLVVRSTFAGGASEKLVARSLDGTGYVSLNLYRLEAGPRLKPCEMPAQRVADFLADLTVPGPPPVTRDGARSPRGRR
nr:hypothetical protein [Jannaschia seohaensis]